MTIPTWRVHPVSPEKPPKAPYPYKVKIRTLTSFHKYSIAVSYWALYQSSSTIHHVRSTQLWKRKET